MSTRRQSVYSGTGTYTDSSGSNATVQETNTECFTLSEQGTFGNGSLSISSYVFSLQQSSTQCTSQSGSWTETFSGTNQGQNYSGTDSGTYSDTANVSSSGSMTMQGTVGNNSFNLSLVCYVLSGSDNFSSSQSDNSNWTGGYSGSSSGPVSSSGSGNWSISGVGSYSGGSWSLSSYVLQSNSAGSFSNSNSDADTLRGSHGTMSNQVTSYNWNDSGSSSASLYQSGTATAGVYSNSSYALSNSASETLTTSETVDSTSMYSGSDTLTSAETLSVMMISGGGGSSYQYGRWGTGSGLSGSMVQTGVTTYSWENNGLASHTSATAEQSATLSLAPGMVAPPPMGTSVPTAGPEQDSGMSPVSSSPDLSMVGVFSGWMLVRASGPWSTYRGGIMLPWS